MDAVTKYTERAAKRAQELKDLDVDRVDLVDKPATGRAFLLFKNKEAAVREYPIESQPTRTGPRTADLSPARVFDPIADEGSDAMGRAYADQDFVDQYASLGGVSPIPSAGAGPTFEGDTRDLDNDPTRFPTRVGGRLAKPTQEYAYNEVGPMKMPGGMRLLSPANSGIAEPLDFKKPEPATVVKGVFTDKVMSPVPESNVFDAPQSDAEVKKSGGSIWGSLFSNPRDKDK